MNGKRETYFYEAEKLYVKAGKSLAEISRVFPVSATSLSTWKKDGSWAEKRRAFLRSTRGAVEILRDELEKLVEGLSETGIDTKKSDEISKISATIDRMERSTVSLMSSAVQVMDKFTDFLKKYVKDVDELKRISLYIREFFNSIEGE